uniref:Uncharacterized protein n=1 Tax=Anguilla anguilla TaxID=7936 RepID=A0A0E9WVU1_ANGAN
MEKNKIKKMDIWHKARTGLLTVKWAISKPPTQQERSMLRPGSVTAANHLSWLILLLASQNKSE